MVMAGAEGRDRSEIRLTKDEIRVHKVVISSREKGILRSHCSWCGQRTKRFTETASMAQPSSLLTHVTQTIINRFHPKRIMVFGSHARGEAGPDSDLDLFIEMETPRRPPERAIEVSEAFGLRAWPMDIVVYTPEEVRRLRHVKGTLLSVIEKEGKVLYEQP